MDALSANVMLESLKQVGLTVIVIILLTVLLEFTLYLIFVRLFKHKYALPIMLLAPAAIGLVMLVVYPICYELSLALSNMSLDNFKRSYNITEQALKTLQEEGIPADALLKLQGLTEQEFESEEALLDGLEPLIGAEALTAHKEDFLASAQRKENLTFTENSLETLREQGLADEILAKLEPVIGQTYTSELLFVNELKKKVGQDVMAEHSDLFVESAQKATTLKLTKRSFLKLRKIIPEDVLVKLQEQQGLVNKTYFSQKVFLDDIGMMVGEDALTQHQEAFLTHGLANPGPTFGIAEGLRNFQEIFTKPVLKQVHFFPVLWRTIIWTAIQVPTHVILGLGLAMLMNRPMKLRGLYRTLIIVPWAIPQVIAVLAWRGEFHSQYGFFNIILTGLGFAGIEWKTNPFWNFVAINMTNIWLGVPFMMVILLGGLQSISHTFYEAADVDGATRWDKFRHITLPLLQPVMTPAIILGVIWTFNNFNVPYLINDNELESSDILVTALFRAAFEYNRYGFAAAFAVVIFVILLVFCLIYMRIVKLDLGLAGEKKKKA